jgi:hypothetical protein
MEKKIVVVIPEGMYNAVVGVLPPHVRVQLSAMMGFPGVQRILEAALRWLAENPIEPHEGFGAGFMKSQKYRNGETMIEAGAVEWQRRCFLAPEPEVPEIPEAVRDLLRTDFFNALDVVMGSKFTRTEEKYQASILEAYRRGVAANPDPKKWARVNES